MLISISDLIKKTIAIYQKHFSLIVKYLLLALIPGFSGAFLTHYILRWVNEVGSYDSAIIYVGVPLIVIFYTILIIFSLWFNFALIKAIHQFYLGETPKTIKEILLDTKHIIYNGFITSIMSGLYSGWPLIIVVCLTIARLHYSDYLPETAGLVLNILLPVAGLYAILHLAYWAIKLCFSMFITILENKDWKQALSESKSLVNGRWSVIAARIVVPVFVIYFILMLIDITLATIGSTTGDVGNAIMTVVDLFVNYLAVPVSLIVGVVLFEEAKKTPNTINIETPPTV